MRLYHFLLEQDPTPITKGFALGNTQAIWSLMNLLSKKLYYWAAAVLVWCTFTTM